MAAEMSLVRRPKVLERTESRAAFLWRILDHLLDPDGLATVLEKEREDEHEAAGADDDELAREGRPICPS